MTKIITTDDIAIMTDDDIIAILTKVLNHLLKHIELTHD